MSWKEFCLRKMKFKWLIISLAMILIVLFQTGCGGLFNQTIEQTTEISPDNSIRTSDSLTPDITIPTVTVTYSAKTIPPIPVPTQLQWTVMVSPGLGISVSYPEDWSIILGSGKSDSSTHRLRGESGFFQFGALDAVSIEQAVDIFLGNEMQLFGSQPVIEVMQVQGQDARLILPSTDQPLGREGETAMIIRFQKPVYVCDPYCRYLVLWSDVDHIREIAMTIRFIGE